MCPLDTPDTVPSTDTAARALLTGVVMRREPVAGPMARWQPWRWVLADVVVLQGPPGVACVQWPLEVPVGPLALEPAGGAASPDVHHWGFP